MAEFRETEIDSIIDQCELMLDRSYCIYSNFAVASVIVTECGKQFTGCNVENASYGLAICAERTAAVKAVSEGYRKFKSVFVMTRSPNTTAPCGACRQFLAEFGLDASLYLVSHDRKFIKSTVRDILPLAFTSADLGSSSPPTACDNQKVPPLRIVLNSSTQKSSSAPITVPSSTQKESTKKDAKIDIKPPEKVHVKFAPPSNGRQGSNTKQGTSSGNPRHSRLNTQENRGASSSSNSTIKEENTITYSHLRRITRRSQKTVQTITNEEEESMSSMTSVDENTNTNNSNSDNSNGAVENTVNPNARTSSDLGAAGSGENSSNGTTISSLANQGNSNASEVPKRYKRRRVEIPEYQISELESQFGYNNYRPPHLNSFELYRNIRNQVDKKLRGLNCVQPKTPHGIREYMLAKGAYLLDGNKLGNGMNLLFHEDGTTHLTSVGRFSSLKPHRIQYSVPHRAQVPLSLPINTPLYNLFFEQERERHKMRMQHVKEREKLTLAAEQEVVRVYNKAALEVANQPEPFSACTMLKHQEIYNYVDNDGVIIMPSEPAQPDSGKQDGVRTRRRQHEHIPVGTSSKNSEASDKKESIQSDVEKKSDTKSLSCESTVVSSCKEPQAETKDETSSDKTSVKKGVKFDIESGKEVTCSDDTDKEDSNFNQEKGTSVSEPDSNKDAQQSENQPVPDGNSGVKDGEQDKNAIEDTASDESTSINKDNVNQPIEGGDVEANTIDEKSHLISANSDEKSPDDDSQKAFDTKVEPFNFGDAPTETNQMPVDCEEPDTGDDSQTKDGEPMEISPSSNGSELSEDKKTVQGREEFLRQLQKIDDKWETTRREMLIRHKNEAESLYAIQRLEWEWKAKEMGLIDIRDTAVIDLIHVPKLNIYTQDY